MIQMSGAPTGLLVTEGFRDEIELRRCYKEDIWDPGVPGAGADRAPARAPRGRRAPDRRGRRRHPARRGRRPRAPPAACVRSASRRSRSCSCTRTSTPRTSCGPASSSSRSTPTSSSSRCRTRSTRSRRSSSARRRRSSTRTSVRRSCGYLGRLEQRLRDAGFTRELLDRDVARAVSPRPTRSAAARSARSAPGPTGGVVAAARAAARRRARRRRQRRHGRHQLRRLPHPRRPPRAQERLELAPPLLHRARRWSTSTRSARAAGRSRASTRGGAARRARVGGQRARARSATGAAAPSRPSPTPTWCSVASTPTGFWGGRRDARRRRARARRSRDSARTLGLDAEDAAVAVVRLVDAHMTDADAARAVARGRRPAPPRPRARSAAWARCTRRRRPRRSGCSACSCPRARPGFSALGLVTRRPRRRRDARRTCRTGARVDLAAAERARRRARGRRARDELAAAGVARRSDPARVAAQPRLPGPDVRQRASRSHASAGAPITPDDVAACVEEFHRRNEEARLIEARSQEPMVRGIRLVATGLVDQPTRRRARARRRAADAASRTGACTRATRGTTPPVFDGDGAAPRPADRRARARRSTRSRRWCSAPATSPRCRRTATSSSTSRPRPDFSARSSRGNIRGRTCRECSQR